MFQSFCCKISFTNLGPNDCNIWFFPSICLTFFFKKKYFRVVKYFSIKASSEDRQIRQSHPTNKRRLNLCLEWYGYYVIHILDRIRVSHCLPLLFPKRYRKIPLKFDLLINNVKIESVRQENVYLKMSKLRDLFFNFKNLKDYLHPIHNLKRDYCNIFGVLAN